MPTVSAAGAADLQSADHRDLLDIIDNLRSQGCGSYVDLPEIIVCGDQSSGKSSVLEAISGTAFPAKDTLCTLFATELVLRRHETAGVKISIIPSDDRFEAERQRLKSWQPESHDLHEEGQDLGDIIEQAKFAMGLSASNVYCRDILRIELSGPQRPHLTLVDLPGIFRAGNKDQPEGHVKLVQALVENYMRKPRSIILAVVSAKNEYVLQDVVRLAKAADPQGLRTMGLVTKPDTLTFDSGPDTQRWWLNLVQNQDVKLELGWHVLKNRSYDQRHFTSWDRDEDEAKFFSEGMWSSIDPSQRGVRTLKGRLSTVLKQQILRQLPSLIRDVEEETTSCENRLARLGDQRQTPQDQIRYLSKVSENFTNLTRSAVQGTYTDEFFGNPRKGDDFQKRLRAVVQARLHEFAEEMRSSGKAQEVVESDSDSVLDDRNIGRSEYLDKIKILMRRSKGCELPGLFNPLIVSDLFMEQSSPWPEITEELVGDTMVAVYKATRLILEEVAVEEVAEEILEVINRGIEKLKEDVDDKLQGLQQTRTRLHPITYNRQLTENVQKSQRERLHRAMRKKIRESLNKKRYADDEEDYRIHLNPEHLGDLLCEVEELDMDRFGSSIVLDYVEAYYKVTLERYIDDVSVLVIEDSLISQLPLLFTPGVVRDLGDTDIARMVGESDSAVLERKALFDKKNILETGLRGLNRLYRHRDSRSAAAAKSTHLPKQEDHVEDDPELPGTTATGSLSIVGTPPEESVEVPLAASPARSPSPVAEAVPAPTDDLLSDSSPWPSYGLRKKKKKKQRQVEWPPVEGEEVVIIAE